MAKKDKKKEKKKTKKKAGLSKTSKKPVTEKKIVKTKSSINHDYSKLAELRKILSQIVHHKSVKTAEVEKHIKKVEPRNVINSTTKPKSLKHLEKKVYSIHKKLKTAKISKLPPKEMKKIKHVAKELKKHEIITDFDMVMDYVKKYKKVRVKMTAKNLQIYQKRIEECAKILEENGLIEIDYPIIGDVILKLKGYKPAKKIKPKIKKSRKRFKWLKKS